MNKTLEYLIKIVTDLRGSKEAKKALEDVDATANKRTSGGMLDEISNSAERASSASEATAAKLDDVRSKAADTTQGSLFDGVSADAEKASQNTDKLNDELDELKDKKPPKEYRNFWERVGGDLKELRSQVPLVGKAFDVFELVAKGPIAAVAAGIAGITAALKVGAVAWRSYLMDSERMAGVDSRLAQQGVLTKALRKELLQLADQMQSTTAIADNEWADVLGKLVQFGANPKSIGMDVEAVKNLAAILEGDLAQATRLYTRALQGQFGQFAELGIVIDLNASQTERLAQLQRFAADKGAGILEAQAASAAGSVKQLGNELGDTAEAIGRVIARSGLMQGAIKSTRLALELFRSVLPPTTDQLDGLVTKVPELESAFYATGKAAKDLADNAIKRVSEAAAEATGQLSSMLARLRELEQAELIVTDAKLARDLADVDLQEESGKLTSQQANAKRFVLREKAEDRKREVREIALTKELESNTAALKRQEEKLDELENLASLAQSTRDAAVEDAKADLQRRRSRNISAQEENETELSRITEELREASRKLNSSPNASAIYPDLFPRIQELSTEKRRRLTLRDQLSEEAANLTPEVLAKREDLEALNNQFEAATAAFIEQVSVLEDLRQATTEANASLKLQLDTLRTVSDLEKETRGLERQEEAAGETKEAERLRREQNVKLSQEAAQSLEKAGAAVGLDERFNSLAQSLKDGSNAKEVQEIMAAVDRGISTLSEAQQYQMRENEQVRDSLREMVTRMNLLASQVENLR